MAVVGIWKIEKRLDSVLKYTTNIEKTSSGDLYNDLHNVIDYTKSDLKTEKQLYVTGINCSPESALEEMVNTKKHYNKTSGILGFHAFQSFAEGEVTPEQAHGIGIKLANEMWGDRFEVVISTHLNTNHYHNHFVINSVSFKDGLKYYDTYESYAELRQLNDDICREYNLSVLEEKRTRKGINYSNYYKSNVKKSNYHTNTKIDIDNAIKQAYSYRDFEKILTNMGYELIYRSGKLSVRHEFYKKNIRLIRSYGESYSRESIVYRISNEHIKREAIPISKHNKAKYYNFKHNKSLSKMFIYYNWLLKVVPKKYPTKYVSHLIREDVKKLDLINEETRFLVSNKLNTYEEFFLYRNKITLRLNELSDTKEKIIRKNKNEKNQNIQENTRKNIKDINKELESLAKEVKICRNIEFRYKDISDKLKKYELEQYQKKERDKIYESR